MTGRLVLLKLRLLANQFRRSPWQVAGLIIAVLYGASITALLVFLLVALRFAPIDTARTTVVALGSVAVLASAAVPVLVGVDDALDPRRFALFGTDRTRLAVGLAVAAVVGVPGAALLLVSFATVATWSRSPAAALVALLAVPVSVVLCTLLGRCSAALAGQLLSTRRSRETVSLTAVVALVVAAPLIALLSNAQVGGAALGRIQAVTDVLAWTPLGAVWAAPAGIAAGDAAGLLQFAIGVATVALLAVAWRALVGRAMVGPARAGRAQTVAGLGWFARLPATPLGAVAARSITYWQRDVRYRVSALVLPITPIALVLVLGLVDVPVRILALVPVPVLALFAGWLSHNDVAYDGTAVWLHVAAGTRGAADRIGRLVPVLAVAGPLLVAGSIASAFIAGDPPVAAALIGVSGCLLLAGTGLGGVSSALLPYPVPRPGESPFQQPNATGGLSAAVQSVLFLLQLLAAAPSIVLGLLGLTGSSAWYWASLLVGLAVGAVVFRVGTAAGGRAFERRGPELLASALRV